MREMSANTWLRRGSSVVFDRESLGPLITGNCLISLRQVLGWMQAWPGSPGGNGDTVLVCGLETCMEVFPDPSEAEVFLRSRIKPFIKTFEAKWPKRGLVFGFAKPAQSFEITPLEEEVLFIRNDHQKVHLSFSMWDGSTTLDVTRIYRNSDLGKQVTVGYHVSRIS